MQHLEPSEVKRRERILIEQCDGIESHMEAFYIQSIIYSAKAAIGAFDRFASSILHEKGPEPAVFSVQEALGHAAGLSKFFWPSRETALANARAGKLRKAFQMSEDSALKSRSLRNSLEHFDERLDDFVLHGPVGAVLPTPILEDHHLADDPVSHVFKLVDPSNFVFVLLGTKYDFLPIHEEISRTLTLAEAFDHAGCRLPRS